jgi:hypothetical protein
MLSFLSVGGAKLKNMKAIGKCEVCGGKIIKGGNDNVFCENCADKNFGQRLQEWADRKELQRIKRRALANER